MDREQILMGRVKVGKTASYEIADHSKHLKMVSFIDREGNILSGSYAQLHIASATDEYLNLEFTRHKVFVKGRCLAKISGAIAAHRLVYLREAGSHLLAAKETPVAEKISFLTKGESAANIIQHILNTVGR